MIDLTGSTLFIIGSPFQCLCMLEAINYWHISDYDVIVNSTKVNELMISRLLQEKNIKYESDCRVHLFKQVLPLVFSKRKHYDNVFIGNYYNIEYQDIALAYCKCGANVIFMDDGIQVLELFSDHPRIIKNETWVILIQFFFSFYAFFKRINRSTFFTIYDVKSNKFNIEKNAFEILNKGCCPQTKDVFIIGTNSSKLVLKDKEYKDILGAVINHCGDNYPGQDIIYCPHRGDKNNDTIKNILIKHKVLWFETKVSVEYDFVKENIYPKVIVGFNSNALFTLHSIFPNAEVYNVYFEFKDKNEESEAKIIRNRLTDYGIATISV